MAVETATVSMGESGAQPRVDPVAAAADGNRPAADGSGGRPEGLPEGFNSVAELAAALEASKAAKGAEPKPADTGPKPSDKLPPPGGDAAVVNTKEDPKEGSEEGKAKADPSAAFDPMPYYQEFADKGEVSASSISEIAKKLGVADDFVREHIQYRASFVEAQKGEIFKVAGGEESFNTKVGWAAKSWPEYSVFYDAITKGDYATAKVAMRGLNAAYVEAEGKEPNLVKGTAAGGNTGLKPFASRSEQSAAMKDPKYRTSAAYRSEVAQRSKGLKGHAKPGPAKAKRVIRKRTSKR